MIDWTVDKEYKKIFSIVNLLVFIAACILNLIAYGTLTSILIFPLFLCCTIFLLTIVISKSKLFYVSAFIKLSIINWFMSGIAAIFLSYGNDPSQLYGDADSFFKISIGSANDFSIDEIKLYHEGSLAILIWKYLYNILFSIGIPKERYIGIVLNIISVSLSGLLIIKSVSVIYPNEDEKIRRCLKYVSFCGLMWLYASIHLRDGFLLLVLSYFYYVWVAFINSKEKIKRNFLRGLIITLITTIAVIFLRGSIAFLPSLISLVAILIFIFSQKKKITLFISVITIFILVSVVFIKYGSDINSIFESLKLLNSEYSSLSVDQHSSTPSLGVSLIISQPFVIRLPIGLAYLFLFPIPIWSSFTQGAYWLFISCNTILLYFLIPNFIYAIVSFYKNNVNRNKGVLFSFISFFFLSIGISSTSLEIRHLGTLLPFFFILAVNPNYENSNVKKKIIHFRLLYVSIVILIHLIWIILKFFY